MKKEKAAAVDEVRALLLGFGVQPCARAACFVLCGRTDISCSAAVVCARAQVNLYERLGEAVLKRVSTAFYERVYADLTPLPGGGLLREAFANTTKVDAADAQSTFLIERLGGPKLYTERKGPFALIGRHAPYAGVTREAAHRWLAHMDAALAAVPEVDEDSASRLRAFFHYTAFFIVEGRALVNPHRLVGYGGSKHDGGV